MKKYTFLFLIIAAAFIVRIIGINFGLPFAYHDDEPLLVNYALAYGVGDLNPHVFNIAPLLTYILFFLYGIFYIVGHALGYFHSLKDFAYLYLSNPTFFYLIGRSVFGLFCGTVSVLAVYFLGKKYFNKTAGILGSLFLALNFLHVRDSHYIYSDIPLTLCVLIFFLKAHDFFIPAGRKDYIQLGALLGLAISVKYQGVSLLLPFFISILYNLYLSKEVRTAEKRLNLIFCGLSFLLVVFIANPFLFLNFSSFISKAQKFPYIPVPFFYHLKISLFNGCGIAMALFGLAGILWALINKDKRTILAIYVVFYYILITKVTQPGERLVLPIVPIVLLFAAYLAAGLGSLVKNRIFAASAIFIMSAFLMYPSLARIYYSDLLFTKEDTRTQAYRWIKDNIKSKSKIALDATSSGFPRLERDKEQLKELENYFGAASFKKPDNAEQTKLKFILEDPFYPDKTYYLFYLRGFTKRGFLSIYPCINVSYQELESKDVDYVVLSGILGKDKYADFVKEAEKHAVLVKEFSPYKNGISRINTLEEATVPAAAFMERELFSRDRYGPYIRIYQIRK